MKKSSIITAASLAFTLGMTPSTTFSQSKASQYVKEFESLFPQHRFDVDRIHAVEAAHTRLCVTGGSEPNETVETWLRLLSEIFGAKHKTPAYRKAFRGCPKNTKIFLRVFEDGYQEDLVVKDHKEFSTILGTPQFSKPRKPRSKDLSGAMGVARIFGWSEKWNGSYAKVYYHKRYTHTPHVDLFDQLFKRVIIEELYHSTIFALENKVLRYSRYGIYSLVHEPSWIAIRDVVKDDDAAQLGEYLKVITTGLCEFDVFSMVAIDEFYNHSVPSQQQSAYLEENFDRIEGRVGEIMRNPDFSSILERDCWRNRRAKTSR